jgi:hypothetical protein
MDISYRATAAQFAVSVSGTALPLSGSPSIGFTAAQVAAADVLIVSVEGQAVRWSVAPGVAPTAANGHAAAVGDTFQIRGRTVIENFQVIAQTGTATLHCTLLKR